MDKCKSCRKWFVELKRGEFCGSLCEKDYNDVYKPCPICHEKDIRVEKKACSGCKAKTKAQKNNWDKSSKKCHICANMFKPNRRTDLTCSKKCSETHVRTCRLKPKVEVACGECEALFTKSEGSATKYCSKKCSSKARIKKNAAKRKLKNKPLKTLNCVTCDKEFKQSVAFQKKCNPKCKKKTPPKTCKCGSKVVKGNKLYCDLCKPKKLSKPRKRTFCKKAYKKAEKLKCRKARPASVSWKSIQDVYDGCPKGMEVDHIVPRNHPKICGLHVPWNLQYLTPEENRKKSNKWESE